MNPRPDHTLLDRDGVARNARALTIHQPWASLIAQGIKRLENRTWTPPPDDLALGDYVLQRLGEAVAPSDHAALV